MKFGAFVLCGEDERGSQIMHMQILGVRGPETDEIVKAVNRFMTQEIPEWPRMVSFLEKQYFTGGIPIFHRMPTLAQLTNLLESISQYMIDS